MLPSDSHAKISERAECFFLCSFIPPAEKNAYRAIFSIANTVLRTGQYLNCIGIKVESVQISGIQSQKIILPECKKEVDILPDGIKIWNLKIYQRFTSS